MAASLKNDDTKFKAFASSVGHTDVFPENKSFQGYLLLVPCSISNLSHEKMVNQRWLQYECSRRNFPWEIIQSALRHYWLWICIGWRLIYGKRMIILFTSFGKSWHPNVNQLFLNTCGACAPPRSSVKNSILFFSYWNNDV